MGRSKYQTPPWALRVVGSVIPASMVVIALRGHVHDRLLVRVCVLVVAVAIAGVVWLREAPAALYADDDGITVRNPDRTVRLRWQDISDFYVAPWHGRAQYAWVRTVSGDDIPVRG